MVASARRDERDSHVVEIEFETSQAAESFINLVNTNNVDLLRSDVQGEVRAGYAFAPGPPGFVDTLEPRRDWFVAVRVPSGRDSGEIARALHLSKNFGIRAANRRPMFIPASIPTDPRIGTSDRRPRDGSPATQWYLHRCAVPHAWSYTHGKNVIVADIDWGFDLTHPELAGRFDPHGLHNVLNGDCDVSVGELSHGTGAAGLIGAAADGTGIAGVAPECTLWLLQAGVMRGGIAEPPPELFNPWASAVEWVLMKSAPQRKIINLEVQTGTEYSAEGSCVLRGAIRRAASVDVIVTIAAGNGKVSVDRDEHDCDIPDTGSIVVAATGYDDFDNPYAVHFSNYGNRVRLSAPGEPDYDLTCGLGTPDHLTVHYGGTSGASAKVAGALALLLSAYPALTHPELIEILDGLPRLRSQRPIGAFLKCDELFGAATALRSNDVKSAAG